MRTWDPTLRIDRAAHVPLPQQIARAVVDDICSGRLSPGAALPGSRTWARALGVHRNTILAALDELRAQGWIESTRASHTAVRRELPALPRPAAPGRALASEHVGFALPHRTLASRRFEAAPRRVLDFTGGLPDPRLLPAGVLARAYRRALRRGGSELLGFSDPAGHPRLREAVADMLRARRGLLARAEDIVITRGSQLAHHLLALALWTPGDRVAVESPGYPSLREGFALLGARIVPIPVDADGMQVDVLARTIKRSAVRAVSVTPLLQDPTTATLSAARRLELLALARTERLCVLEADYDYEFQLDGASVRPLAADDDAGVVLYVGTLTKALAAGVRLGFIVAPRAVRERVLAARAVVDRQGDAALELAVAELMEDGELMRHAWRARRHFQRRRDTLVQLLETHLGDTVRFRVPRGGLALWVETPGVDVEAWASRALARGVRFFTGQSYDPHGRPLAALRLGFAHLDEDELARAVAVMAQTLPEPTRRARTAPNGRRRARTR